MPPSMKMSAPNFVASSEAYSMPSLTRDPMSLRVLVKSSARPQQPLYKHSYWPIKC